MTFGVKEVREMYGVGEHTVLRWIRAGELKAIDVSPKTGSRPKWRITQAALDAFEALRGTSAPAPPTTRRRKRKSDQVIEFYKS